MRFHIRAALLAAFCLLFRPATAAEPVAGAWQAIARADSDAAIRLIETNHPGAAPELGDAAFQARLATARQHLAERLPRVADYNGYAALMAGLAAEFGDGHIWTGSLVATQRVNTPGILLIRQGGQWVVGVQKALPGEPDLMGWALDSCDDIAAEAWARPRIAAFLGDPDLEAERAKAAAWLLIDQGNPFLPLPKTCRFTHANDAPRDLTLKWRMATMAGIQGALQNVVKPGAAGMKVEPFAGGWWIGLQSLGTQAQAVVDQARANQAALRAAPMVVIDLRGNGGGDSRFSDVIARILVGDARFGAAEPNLPACSGAFWRATPFALETIRGSATVYGALGDKDSQAEYHAIGADMQKAIAEKRAFSPALPACARATAAIDQDKAPAKLPPSAMKGRLVLITDRACFSSCLMAANIFRRLGALHVGEATDRSTRYMEVREITLPSGLRTFSTLQKVVVGLGDFGPYSPAIPYPGSLGDDAALRAWVAALPRKD